MNKSEIEKFLSLTPEEIRMLQKKKKMKAQNLLLKLINEYDEKAALMLVFDKTLEINADMHNMDYNPLYLAIRNGLTNLVKESFFHPSIKHKLNLDKKDNKLLYQSLGQSDNPMLYDFFENMNDKKLTMLSDTIYHALELGKLKLIKHLVNKIVDGQYCYINLERAIIGYTNIGSGEDGKMGKLEEYTNYFANIEKNTQNTYIQKDSKEVFFNYHLLANIIMNQDEESLVNYQNVVSEVALKKDIVTILRRKGEEFPNNQSLTDGIKWFFIKNITIDFDSIYSFKLYIQKNEELNNFYDKIRLNQKISNNLPSKNTTDKRPKI